MTDDKPDTYERQAGEAAEIYGTDDDAQLAKFNDPQNGSVWRPPTATELELIRESYHESQPVERCHVAVIDGYQSDHPGYAGPLAVVVGGDPGLVETVPLKEEATA